MVPGTPGGEMALCKHMDHAKQLLKSDCGLVMFQAATGSGKSKLIL